MPLRWVQNTTNQVRFVNGAQLLPGEGIFVDDGPLPQPLPGEFSNGLYGLVEVTPYVTPTPSGTSLVFSGACELAGWYCSVAAGNITIYDQLSATGTPIVPATPLVAGPMPIMGAGTNGKLALTIGCTVVLSGAATVRVLLA